MMNSKSISTSEVPIPNQIRAFLATRGITMQRIADDLGYDQSFVSHVISGNKKSPRVAKYINTLMNADMLPVDQSTS